MYGDSSICITVNYVVFKILFIAADKCGINMLQFQTSGVVKSKNFSVVFKTIGKKQKKSDGKNGNFYAKPVFNKVDFYIVVTQKLHYLYTPFLFYLVKKKQKSFVTIFFYKRLKFKFLRNMLKSRKFANYFVVENSYNFLLKNAILSFPSNRESRENSKRYNRKNVMSAHYRTQRENIHNITKKRTFVLNFQVILLAQKTFIDTSQTNSQKKNENLSCL
ncbi:hypothetical protein AGLY_002157 [Aphis glycines]|uniref:Uncharacterized protein n=1 Tax=Aphis glycines TaxID=307491 RepID=A0A6G0U326_APHGL|nr:hypothetical protein AGLY_002157 [Aphis glycines]